MPTDPRKRQKKQERRAAKRKAKHHQLARANPTGLAERLATAIRYPVLDSCATTDLWTQGLGWVCLSRELPSGHVAFAVFLVDRYCLGVKNIMAGVVGRFEYDSQVMRKLSSHSSAKDLSPADVRKLVEDAVAYARGLRLHPHPDYEKARHIFGDIDASQSTAQLEFGKDGKPFFVAGPNDTPERCRRILKTLEEACGPGGFHYLIPFPSSDEILPESLRGRNPRVIGPDETGTIRDWDVDWSQDEHEDDEPA